MSGVVEFLLARLDEDESAARDVQHQEGVGRGFITIRGGGTGVREMCDPARVLTEVAAKRRVVASLEEAGRDDSGRHEEGYGLMAAIRCLATAYSSHPDYDKNWRP